jgi:hypothetical protein
VPLAFRALAAVESIGFEEREVELGAVFAHVPQYSKVVISRFHYEREDSIIGFLLKCFFSG